MGAAIIHSTPQPTHIKVPQHRAASNFQALERGIRFDVRTLSILRNTPPKRTDIGR